jgi:hypothetical protein
VSLSANIVPPPAAPSGLNARGFGDDGIFLTWTDNANDEQGFRIERRLEPSGTFAEIAQIGPALTSHSYLDEGLTMGETYTYRVCAFNFAGDSAYSNEDSATPGGAPLDATRWTLYR